MTLPRWNQGRPPVVNPQQPVKPADAVSVASDASDLAKDAALVAVKSVAKQPETAAAVEVAVKAANVNMPSETTSEQDRRTAGQRRVNIIWEATQAVIALAVTGTGMFTASQLALRVDTSDANKSMAITAFLLISNTVFLVIGFYFGRTNHERTGGVVGGATRESR